MDAFTREGWTKNAIAGMLGNMQVESTINPGIWQNLQEGNMSLGYGLVQWTPATVYTSWADAQGYEWGNIDAQIARILHELENGLQYYPTDEYPETFREYTQSTKSPEYLASAFLKNYERAGVEAEADRRNNAIFWFNELDGSEGGGKPFFPTTEGLPISSPYGWRYHPITGEYTFHAGIDISGEGVEHPIYATQTGVVIENTWNDISGWRVRIKHTGDPYYSQYLHLAVQSPIPVGTTVTKGQVIGTMGSTGGSTGIHLDFAISINGTFFTEEDTIDPEVYLQMSFGGGDGPPSSRGSNIIELLLCDALNGWKF